MQRDWTPQRNHAVMCSPGYVRRGCLHTCAAPVDRLLALELRLVALPSSVATEIRVARSCGLTIPMAKAQEDAIGLIRRALVLRAKYRVHPEKCQVPCVHLGGSSVESPRGVSDGRDGDESWHDHIGDRILRGRGEP